MTAEDFCKHETNRTELYKLISDPVFILACGVLKKELEPSPRNGGVLNPTVGAGLYQQIAGVNHILDGLDRLTRPYEAPTRLTRKELLQEQPLT